MNVILWDFDGTLAHREGMWSGTLAGLAQRRFPDRNITVESIRPHLQSGFPWHQPERTYGQRSSNQWWNELNPVFANAFAKAGLPRELATELSKSVKNEYIQSEHWSVYDDVEDCLSELSKMGWKHLILSNHVPELPSLVQELGLSHHFEHVITSALVGFEKPHPSIFEHAIGKLPANSKIWMVGDSYSADVAGAESQGIPAILVRKEHALARFSCSSLRSIASIINKNSRQ